MPLFISRQAKTKHQHGKGTRIPSSLQAVFLSSNRGAEVIKPPPSNSAFKVFLTPRTWFHNSYVGKKSKKSFIPANRKSSSGNDTEKGKNDGGAIAKDTPKSKSATKKKAGPIPTLTPQQYLESLLRSRGYSTECCNALETGYYNKPTSYQEASYGVYMVDTVRQNDTETLKQLFQLGLHPNACNVYGESIVHLACRRGNYQVLQTMIDYHCTVQVADDYGRTPLHDLCWATEPSLEAAAMILEIDPRMLFVRDTRGSVPFVYARKEHYATWIQFLESHKDEYWPKHGIEYVEGSPQLATVDANTRPLPDPQNTLPISLTKMVASGKMKPSEAEIIRHDFFQAPTPSKESSSPSTNQSVLEDNNNESLVDNDDDDDDGDGDKTDSESDSVESIYDDDDNEDDSLFDIDEMADIVDTIHAIKATKK